MLIQITNKCRMECTHCMQCSDASGKHMTMADVDAAVKFATLSKANFIIISGGEPTEHPHFKEIVSRFLKFTSVIIATNGMWIDDDKMVDDMKWIVSHPNVCVQVSHFEGFYPKEINIDKIHTLFPDICTVTDRKSLNLLALGRVREHPELMKETEQGKGTMSCFSSALVSAQLPYTLAIQNMEIRFKFCHPLVDINGDLHWSESWLCPSFANIKETFEDICIKAHNWRPCMRCHDAQKLRNNNSTPYLAAKVIMEIR